jgi:hypothetical protein
MLIMIYFTKLSVSQDTYVTANGMMSVNNEVVRM